MQHGALWSGHHTQEFTH